MADEANEPLESPEPTEPAESPEPVEESAAPAEWNEGALAAELYRAEREHRTRWIVGGVGAIVCAVIGGGIVLAVVLLSPNLLRPAPPVVVKNELGSIKPTIPNVATYHPDAEPPKTPPAKDPPKSEPNAAKPPVAQGPSKMPPFNPFEGGPVPGDWQKGKLPPIKGNIGVKPDEGPGETPKVPTPTQDDSQATLVTARSGGGDAESDAEAIVKALQNAGASVRSANHYGGSGSIAGVQIVASLPAASLENAKTHLQSAGVNVGDPWQGAPTERASRLSSILSDRIAELRKARTTLLEKFLDDAPQVTQVDEEIQKLNQCLGMARINGKSPKIAIIVIGVGAL